MTEQRTPGTDAAPTAEFPSDLVELEDRPAVDVCEHTFVHDDADHCEADARGRVIVGVTDTDGAVLVLEHEEAPFPHLPNEVVEAGEDWSEVARRAAADSAGAPVRVDRPLRLRHVDHVVEGENEPRGRTAHLVVRASLETAVDEADDPFPADCDWTAHWLEAFPEAMVDEESPPVEDVRLLFE